MARHPLVAVSAEKSNTYHGRGNDFGAFAASWLGSTHKLNSSTPLEFFIFQDCRSFSFSFSMFARSSPQTSRTTQGATQPTMDTINDVFSTDSNGRPLWKIVPARPTLDGIPSSIRQRIFSLVLQCEQTDGPEGNRTWVGIDGYREALCLPLANLRPPPLVRVNRQFREEYLPYFFGRAWFCNDARVSVNSFEVTDVLLSELDTRLSELDAQSRRDKKLPRLMDASASAWLHSIRHIDNLKFRRVIYRPVSSDAMPKSVSLSIEYYPKRKQHHLNRYICNTGLRWKGYFSSNDDVSVSGDKLHGTAAVALSFTSHCSEANGVDFLDLDTLLELEATFRRFEFWQEINKSMLIPESMFIP